MVPELEPKSILALKRKNQLNASQLVPNWVRRVQDGRQHVSKIDQKSMKNQEENETPKKASKILIYKPVSAQEREARSIKITFAQVLHSNTGNDSRAHANQSKQTQDSFEMVRELASHLESVKIIWSVSHITSKWYKVQDLSRRPSASSLLSTKIASKQLSTTPKCFRSP